MFCDHLVSSYASNYVRSFIRVAKHPERATSSYMHSLNEEKKERKKGERNHEHSERDEKVSLSYPPQPVNLARDTRNETKSLEPCGCRQLDANLQFPSVQFSPPLPCHRRSITARHAVCTALHVAILFINATNPRLRVSRVCAARTRYFLPRAPPSAQNIRTDRPRWTSVNRPSFNWKQFSPR